MRLRDARFFRLKAAMADLIERAGGIARAAERVGLSSAMMGRINHRDDDSMMSIDCKARLEADAGEPIVTRVEAELLGFGLQRIAAAPPSAGTALDAHAAVLAEVADLCGAFAQAFVDGRYSRADSLMVDRALNDLTREIERFRRVNAAAQAGAAAGLPP